MLRVLSPSANFIPRVYQIHCPEENRKILGSAWNLQLGIVMPLLFLLRQAPEIGEQKIGRQEIGRQEIEYPLNMQHKEQKIKKIV